MPHPKKKVTRARRNSRRSKHGIKKVQLKACDKCKQPVKPHNACSVCGTYKKRQVIKHLAV